MNQQSGIYEKIGHQKWTAVPFNKVLIGDGFWSPWIKTHQNVTLQACLDQCEQTGRLSNFAKAAGLLEGEYIGRFYNDSDVYKVLEGVAYSLINRPDPELEARADQIIDWIAASQREDGYLNSYYSLTGIDGRWTDMNMHECYCAGHMIEAAVAYEMATGKRKLLEASIRMADHMDSLFGPGKRNWVPGHQEIELALVKLYQVTGEERYWKLAYFFLEQRGKGNGEGYSWNREDWGAAYCQDDVPVRELSRVTGHAVRAVYMYAGMADVAAIAGDQGYMEALERVWDNVVNRNMYATGGIGPSKHNEGFTEDYDLPNDTAYCETCAAVGMVYWNHRMHLMTGDSKYVNVLERSLFNGVLSGVSLSGDKFFYVNPLESSGHHHRVPWYECSCCPTQIARFLPSIGNYIYSSSHDGVRVNLYIANTASIPIGNGSLELRQETFYPWKGNVILTVQANTAAVRYVDLRIPDWCKSFELRINGWKVQRVPTRMGYVRLERDWREGDRIELTMEMPVERIHAHPKVMANTGKVALQRGPLVYCMEQADNGDADYDSLYLDRCAKLLTEHDDELLGGVTVIYALHPEGEPEFRFVPYYGWDNRERGYMKVWVDERGNPEVYTR